MEEAAGVALLEGGHDVFAACGDHNDDVDEQKCEFKGVEGES